MRDESRYAWHMEWGRRGARAGAERGDLIVIVDVLRFSSAVIAAVQNGLIVYPVGREQDPAELAQRMGAELAIGSKDVPGTGRYSLSPQTLASGVPGTKVVLPSLNGSACSAVARQGAAVVAGGILNARAVADYCVAAQERTRNGVTIVACGEQWQDAGEDEDHLRPAVEDYMGAGAILSHVQQTLSPDATVCRAAFQGTAELVEALIWECSSGRELRDKGLEDDVRFCARLDAYAVVPVLLGGAFWRLE
jgi:2-phosphosulfolactate phosphatase